MYEEKVAQIVPLGLFSREIRPIRNWHEWLMRWQVAETIEEMLGLLHVGFSVEIGGGGWREPEYELSDRVEFYLTVADGWMDADLLERSGDSGEYYFGKDEFGNRSRKRTKELRQVLARKAFDMLATNFFNAMKVKDGYRNQIWDEALTGRLFPVIQNFFRTEKAKYGGRIVVRNLPWRDEVSHNEKRMIGFLLNIIENVWKWSEEPLSSWWKEEEKDKARLINAELRARFDGAKPWTVEVLVYLGRLDILRGLWESLDVPSITRLKEIALRTEVPDPETPRWSYRQRRAKTLEEAVHAGSLVAGFLVELDIKRSEARRFKKIREALEARTKAERALEELK